MAASAQMHSSSLWDLFLTLYTCLAAWDQTGTGLYWQKCSYQAKTKDSSSNPSSISQILSAALSLPLGSPAQDPQWPPAAIPPDGQEETKTTRLGQPWEKEANGGNLTGIFKYLFATCRGGRAGLFTEARNKCSCMGNSSYVAEMFSPCVVRVDSLRKGTELLLS